jgi:hypothetical protein
MSVRMWATLPKDHTANGLGVIEAALVDDPDAEHIVIARINRRRVTTDDDTGDTIPTARVVHIEVIRGELEADAREILGAAHRTRTGEETLPFGDE